jgi:hypothetical protein
MDESNRQILNASSAKAKLLLDANVFSYAEVAYQATGYHLLDYLETIAGTVDWFVGSRIVVSR